MGGNEIGGDGADDVFAVLHEVVSWGLVGLIGGGGVGWGCGWGGRCCARIVGVCVIVS